MGRGDACLVEEFTYSSALQARPQINSDKRRKKVMKYRNLLQV